MDKQREDEGGRAPTFALTVAVSPTLTRGFSNHTWITLGCELLESGVIGIHTVWLHRARRYFGHEKV